MSKPPHRILCRHVIAGAAKHFGCSPAILTSSSRKSRVVYPRQVAMYVCRILDHSYPKIGGAFNRDHSTVLYAVAKIATWSASKETARQDVRSVHDLALAEATLEQAVTRAHVARLEEARAS